MAKNQMARRRQRAPRYSVPVVEQPSITPEAKIGLTFKQLGVGIGLVAAGALAWGALKWDNAETRSENSQIRRDVAEIKKTQETFTASTPAALKDQDDKRARLGEQFLASNKLIADKVGDLATAIAVQQANAKNTENALVKISEQLGMLTRQTQPARGR